MPIKNLTKEELLALSKEDRQEFLSNKKSELAFTDSVAHSVDKVLKEVQSKFSDTLKATDSGKVVDPNSLDVKIVCNAAMFCDSKGNVFSKDSYDKSIKLKGNSIPHIADHLQSSTAHVGDVSKVYTEELTLRELGYDVDGKTTALVMESTVRKDYNADVFKFYQNGKINQHSIGLNYENINLAFESSLEDNKVENALWKEVYPSILNKEVVDERGYFIYSNEININETSCVLFGANSLTPTLAVKSDTLDTQLDTQSTKVGNTMTMTLEEALTKNVELSTKVTALEIAKDGLLAEGSSTEQTRILAILDSAKTLGIDQELAMKQIKTQATSDNALTLFEAVKEAVDAANSLNTQNAGDASTLNGQTTEASSSDEDLTMTSFEKAIDAVDKEETADLWGGR